MSPQCALRIPPPPPPLALSPPAPYCVTVTFLALGNGAPDLSSTILAITSGDYNLSLGALTGGGMFVSTCVAGACILTADGAKCRGALVRDVLGYACTILTILLFLVDGYVRPLPPRPPCPFPSRRPQTTHL